MVETKIMEELRPTPIDEMCHIISPGRQISGDYVEALRVELSKILIRLHTNAVKIADTEKASRIMKKHLDIALAVK